MRKRSAILFLVPFSCAVTAFPASAGETAFRDTSFRCGSDLITVGCTMHKIKEECGNPDSEEKISGGKTYLNRKGKMVRRRAGKSSSLTEWTYRRDFGTYVLTFEGTRLIRKEYFKE